MESDSVPPTAVYEYVGEYPPSVPHANANNDVHYVRTLPQTMDKLRKVVQYAPASKAFVEFDDDDIISNGPKNLKQVRSLK